MTWMLTANGATVDLALIEPSELSILDVAHHLSTINRYHGAASRPYSVAEHSLLVADILAHEQLERRPEALMAALMHDAHEAYTNDLSSPMKQLLGAAWDVHETRIQHAVLARFDVLGPYLSHRAAVKWADMTALSTERRALLPAGGRPWPCTGTHPGVTWVDFDARAAFNWRDWRQAFLDRYAELRFAMRHRALVSL